MRRIISFVFAVTLTVLAACNGSKSPERTDRVKPTRNIQYIRIQEPVNGSMFDYGQAIEVKISLLRDTLKPDSIVLFFNNKRVGRYNEPSFALSLDGQPLGNNQIRATAWHNENRQTASIGIKIKANEPPEQLRYKVVNTYPHDITAYTQGLFYLNGHLIESTGQKGSSTLRRVEIKTGKVIQSVNLDRQYFGEGTTIINNEIYQITWTSRKGFVYDPVTFNLIRTFDYLTQGWGLTTIYDKLVMSDGSNILYFLEPQTFTEVKRVEVYNHLGPVTQLNELEYINGKIFANIYLSDKIVIIDPETGMVEAEVDFSTLLSPNDKHRTIDVFNGIAWDEENQRLFVTGKNWPKLFEVKIY